MKYDIYLDLVHKYSGNLVMMDKLAW